MATNGNTNLYPLAKFHFQVQWGASRIGFTDVSGIARSNDVIEYREGSTSVYTKLKMPGLVKYDNVTLKRGMIVGDKDAITWIQGTVGTTPVRRSVKIIMQDDTGAPQFTWLLQNAWVVSYKFTELNSTANEAAIETLELAHEGLQIV